MSRGLFREFGALGIVTVLGLLATACASASTSPVVVEVLAGAPSEFRFEASKTVFEAGKPYRFVIKNSGAVAHEFMIVPREAHEEPGHDSAPQGSEHMDDLHESALVVIDWRDLGPGKTKTEEHAFKLSDAEQALEIACRLPGHYEAGIVLPISVVARV